MISESAYLEFYKISDEIKKNILNKLYLTDSFETLDFVKEIILNIRDIDLLQTLESFIDSTLSCKNKTKVDINFPAELTKSILNKNRIILHSELKQLLSYITDVKACNHKNDFLWNNIFKLIDFNRTEKELIDLLSACLCVAYRNNNPFMHILAKICTERNKYVYAERFIQIALKNSEFMHDSFSEEINSFFKKLLSQVNEYKDLKRIFSIRQSLNNKVFSNPPEGVSLAILKIKKLIEASVNVGGNRIVVLLGQKGSGKSYLARYFHSLEKPDREFIEIPLKSFKTLTQFSDFLCGSQNRYSGDFDKGLLEMNNGGTIFFQNTESLDMPSLEFLRKLLFNRSFITGVTNKKKLSICKTRIILGFEYERQSNFLKKLPVKNFFKDIENIYIPLHSLNERREDIIFLADTFLNNLSLRDGTEKKILSKKVKSRLKEFDWVGGIRQLKSVVIASAMVSSGKIINQAFLPERVLNNFR